MSAGNFLGFLVHQRGIEVDQNKAKEQAAPPKKKNILQKFIGKCPKDISNSAGKLNVFSSLLKLKGEETMGRCKFNAIKRCLASPPVLIPPRKDRPLRLYISAADPSIGAFLAQVHDQGKEQGSKPQSHFTSPKEEIFTHR